MNAFAATPCGEEARPEKPCPPAGIAAGRMPDRLGAAPGKEIKSPSGEIVGRLNDQCEELHMNINRLEERLIAFLTPDFPREALNQPSVPEISPMAEWIHQKGQSVMAANERIRHLLNRIQT